MFHSAAVKLTLWYLGIVMVLSIGTSFALYRVSSNELRENAHRQVGYFGGLIGPNNASDFAILRQSQLDEDLRHLKANLAFFNILVLAGGGVASYALARRTLRPIEDALETQTRFTEDASHELRTPLTAMQTENEVALRDASLTKAQAVNLLRSNLEEVGKLKSLAEGLLTLAHTDSEDDVSGVISTNSIVENAKARVSKAAELKKIRIINPGSQQDILVNGNQQKLTDLLVILLDNSIKYSKPGGEVKIDASRSGKIAEICVSDQGKGIKRTDLPHIFKRFYRTDSSRSKHGAEGYGLGLAIAKKIADRHKASIEVRSAPGKGSKFTLRLPL